MFTIKSLNEEGHAQDPYRSQILVPAKLQNLEKW